MTTENSAPNFGSLSLVKRNTSVPYLWLNQGVLTLWDGTQDIQVGGGDGGPVVNRWRQGFEGRVNLVPYQEWRTDADDLWGSNYYEFKQSGGSGPDPVNLKNMQGMYVKAGTKIVSMDIVGRSNDSSGLIEIEIATVFSYPTDPNRWETGGISIDGQLTNVEIRRDFWLNPPGGPQFTNAALKYRREYDINYVAPVDGWVSTFYRASTPPEVSKDFYVGKSILFEGENT